MPKFIILALLLALAGAAQAEFKPGLMADLRGRYESQPATANSGFGQSSDLFFVPAFAWGPHSVLPVLAYLQAGRGAESAGDGSPELQFVNRNTFLAKPSYRYQWDQALALKAWGIAKRAVNFEKADTAWSKGLYDWEEFGFGLGADQKLGGWLGKLGGGVELQHRGYMNWRELGANLTKGKNYYTKDYHGLKASLEVAGPEKSALPWVASLTWLGKAYTDSYLLKRVKAAAGGETTDGTYDLDTLRFDQLLRLGADLGFGLPAGLRGGVDLSVDWNLSNQNYFDSAYNQGVLDFYGYLAVGGGLSLSWLPWGADSLSVAARAGVNNRSYSGRLIRNPDRRYAKGTQADFEQSYSLDLSYPFLAEGLSAVAGAGFFSVLSNTGFAGQAPTSYELFTTTLGLRYRL